MTHAPSLFIRAGHPHALRRGVPLTTPPPTHPLTNDSPAAAGMPSAPRHRLRGRHAAQLNQMAARVHVAASAGG